MSSVKTDVLIVGAGPTGLALALTLTRAGVDCLVIDSLPEAQPNSRAAVIHAHTLDVLDRIDAAAPLVAKGLPLAKFSIRDRDQAMLALDFSTVPSPHNYLLMLPQNDTEIVLADLLATAGGTLWRTCTARSLAVRSDGVDATLATPDGPRTVTARFVVAADGMHSLVRQTSGIGYSGAANPESFILADVTMDWGLPRDDVMLFFSPAG